MKKEALSSQFKIEMWGHEELLNTLCQYLGFMDRLMEGTLLVTKER